MFVFDAQSLFLMRSKIHDEKTATRHQCPSRLSYDSARLQTVVQDKVQGCQID